MPFIERSGQPNLHYEMYDFTDPWKDAPVMLLQHGFGRSGRFWYSWIPYLSRHFRVVCADLRGLGQSSSDFDLSTDLTVENFLSDLDAVLDHIGVDSVHYCGESLGGIVGVVFAATRPDRVRSLAIVSSPVSINEATQKAFAFGHPTWQDAIRTMGSEEWARAANGATRFPSDADPGLQDWYAREMGKSKPEVLVALSQLAAKVDIRDYLPRLAVPVLGLYPSSALITDDQQEVALGEGIRDLKLVHLPIRFHTIQNLEPAACAKHVLYFAAQQEGMDCHE